MINFIPERLNRDGLDELAGSVEEELTRLGGELDSAKIAQLRESNVAPAKPRDGMIVLADGTNWNPGGGAGFYGYHSGAWNKLG